MTTITLIYGSDTDNTEGIAYKIQQSPLWKSTATQVHVHNIADVAIDSILNEGDVFILGLPTWDNGGTQVDWQEQWETLAGLNLNGKTIALFGLGDQIGYGDTYLDAMGRLHALLSYRGANMVGQWSSQGYEHEQSQALTLDQEHFVGLALDEDRQAEQTDQRIERWIQQLCEEFELTNDSDIPN